MELFNNSDDDNEGERWYGQTVADAGGAWSMYINPMDHPYFTAKATDATNNTSEFSENYTAPVALFHTGSSKEVDRTEVMPGEVFTYTLTLSNTGTVDGDAIFSDFMPPELTWVGNMTTTGGTLTWYPKLNGFDWYGSIATGEQEIITYQVRANEDLENGDVIENSINVSVTFYYRFWLRADPVTVEVYYAYMPGMMR